MGCTSRENDMRQNHARLNYEVTETEGNTINWVTMRRAIGDYENKLDMIYNLRKTVCWMVRGKLVRTLTVWYHYMMYLGCK